MKTKKWIDASGQEIPAKYVNRLDKERDRIVTKHIARAQLLSERLEAFKKELLQDCDKHFGQLLKENKVKSIVRGNYTLTSFDRKFKIEVSVQESISFDDTIQVAQAKIQEYLTLLTKDVDTELQQIVNSAFQTRRGHMDIKRILGLFRLNIKHPLWIEAMELLKKSISRNISKRYVRCWVRQDNGEYKAIELNFSAI